MSVEVADLVAFMRLESGQFDAQVLRADAEVRGLGASTGSALTRVNQLGTVMAGVVVGGLTASVKSAIDFNGMLSKLQANTTLTNAQMGQVSAGIMQIFKSSNAPLQGIVDGFMHVSDMGFGVADSLKIVAEANKSAASAGGDLSTTANLLATVLHEYGKSAADAARYTDVLHQAAAMGNTTFEQFGDAAGKTIAMAANLNVPIQDVSAAFSAITRHGINAAQTSTLLSGALSKIINPAVSTEKLLTKISRETGIDLAGDFTRAGLQSKGLAGVLSDLGRASLKAGTDVMKLIPATRGGLAALILTGNGTRDYTQIQKSLNDTMAGRLRPTQDAWLRTQKQLNFEIGMAWNNVQALGIAIGTQLLPPLAAFLSFITPLIGKIASFVMQHQDWVTAIAGVVGAFLGIKGAQIVWEAALAPIIALLGDFLGPLAVLGLAVAALKAGWDLNFLGLRDTLQNVVLPKVKPILTDLKNLAGDIWTGVSTGKWDAFGKDLGTLKNDAGSLKDAVGSASSKIGSHFNWQGFKDFATWAANGVSIAIRLTGDLAEKVKNWLTTHGPKIVQDAAHTVGLGIHLIGDLVGAVASFVATNGPKVLSAAGTAVGFGFKIVGDLVGAAVAFVKENGPKVLDAAGAVVQFTGKVVHSAGEAISQFVPAAIQVVGNGIQLVRDWIAEWGPRILAAAGTAIGVAFHIVGDAVGAVVAFVKKYGPSVLSAVGTAIGIGFHIVGNIISAVSAWVAVWGPKVLKAAGTAISIGVMLVGDLAKLVGDWIAAHSKEIKAGVQIAATLAVTNTQAITGNAWAAMTAFGAGITDWINKNKGAIGGKIHDAVTGALSSLPGAISSWLTNNTKTLQNIANSIGQVLGAAIGGLTALPVTIAVGLAVLIVKGLAAAAQDIVLAIQGKKGGLGEVIAAINKWIGQMSDAVSQVLTSAFSGIASGTETAIKAQAQLLLTFMGGTGKDSVFYALTHWATLIPGVINDILTGKWLKTQNISGLQDEISHAFNGADKWLTQAGDNLIQGLITGMKQAIAKVGGPIRWILDHIDLTFKYFSQANSPAKRFIPHGVNIVEGIALGMTRATPQLTHAIQQVTSSTLRAGLTSSSAAGTQLQRTGLTAAGAGFGSTQQPIRLQLMLDGKQVYDVLMQHTGSTQRLYPSLLSGRV